MFCTECGKENPVGSKFCAGCGSVLTIIQNLNISTIHTALTETETETDKSDIVVCNGYIKDNSVLCSAGLTTLKDIKIKSFWNNKPINSKCPIYFDYNPVTKEAYNVRKLFRYMLTGIGENNKIEVIGGNFKTGDYSIFADGAALKTIDDEFIGLYNAKISIVSVERAQNKLKSIAIGAVGSLATLGVGAVLGAMHASKKYNMIEVETEKGEFFIAKCRPQAYHTLYSAIKDNCNGVSNKEFEGMYKQKPQSKGIESFYREARSNSIILSIIVYGFIGIALLFFLFK